MGDGHRCVCCPFARALAGRLQASQVSSREKTQKSKPYCISICERTRTPTLHSHIASHTPRSRTPNALFIMFSLVPVKTTTGLGSSGQSTLGSLWGVRNRYSELKFVVPNLFASVSKHLRASPRRQISLPPQHAPPLWARRGIFITHIIYAAVGHAHHDANCSIYANASCASRHGRARAVDGPCTSGHHALSCRLCSEGGHHNRSIHCSVHSRCHTPGGKTTAGGIGRFEFARPTGLRDEAE